MKPKQRKRLEAKKARKPTSIGHLCSQNGHEVFNHPELGTYDAYTCSRCNDCYQCAHSIIVRHEAGSEFWFVCPDGFAKPSYMDVGQFKPLRNFPPTMKGISWVKYSR